MTTIWRRGGIVPAAALFALLAGSCSSLDNTKAEHAQKAMVGMSRSELISCAGEPYAVEKKVVEKKEIEIITYRRAFYQKHKTYGSRVRSCNAAFEVRGDRITKLTYSGASGGTVFNRYHICTPLVESCLKKLALEE